MNNHIIVFLGPSLPLAAAQKILPNACYHPPVRCGDIIKALRLQPKTLVIIDGFFEQTASVWHKEILLALSFGVKVYGASSMGALRAAELQPQGMIGHGKIFEWYRDNVIIDDDEVALVHTAEKNFETSITPMVNVRASLSKAVVEKVIIDVQANALLTELKNQPYYNRSLFQAAQKLPTLTTWLKMHYVDQKRIDAESLLSDLAKNKNLPPIKNPAMTSSVFFNKIFRDMIVTPFEQAYDWLPEQEKQYVQLQQDPMFSNIQRIGKLLHTLHDLIQHDYITLPAAKTHSDAIIAWAKQQLQQLPKKRLLKHLLIYSDLYPTNPQKPSNKTWEVSLSLLNALIYILNQRKAKLNVHKILAFASDFRQKRQLATTEQVMGWMHKNDLKNRLAFEYFVRDMSIVHYFVDHHQGGLLGIETDLTVISWGLEAMKMCN